MQPKHKVLVVDDARENTDLVARTLAEHYDVVGVANGTDALNHVLADPPDLILLDIIMPGMDGFETCKRLKGNLLTEDIPVIFLTAQGQARDVVKGLRLGAVDYLSKPFDRAELLARVDNVAQMLRRQQNLQSMLQARTDELDQSEQLAEQARIEADVKRCISAVQLTTPSRLRYVTRLRDYLNGCYGTLCQACDIDAMGMDLCVNEALANAVIHGNLRVPSSLKQTDWQKYDDLIAERQADPVYSERQVVVHYRLDEQSLVIEIEDEGDGFDPGNLPDPNDPEALLSSGRGILLIRSFMDEVSWNATGNKITMRKNISKA